MLLLIIRVIRYNCVSVLAEEKLQKVKEIDLFLVIYRSVSRGSQVWAPEGSTAFKCLLSARFCAALLSNISDCDETFNYWEPVSTDLKRLKCAALSSEDSQPIIMQC